MIWNRSARFDLAVAVVLLVAGISSVAADNITARAWGASDDVFFWPEQSLESLNTRPNNGICFVGGGTRSFSASLGYLRALSEIGVIDQIRYFVGISGGSWAITSYLFRQHAVGDDIFLGRPSKPDKLTLESLGTMDSQSMGYVIPASQLLINDPSVRLFFGPNSTQNLVEYLAGSHSDSAHQYSQAISKMFLEPLGVPENTFFSWNDATVAQIRARNPSMENSTFILPFDESPYPIIGGAILGPYELAPMLDNLQLSTYTSVEFTPLYSGVPKLDTVTYGNANQFMNITTGGLVESFAFGSAPTSSSINPSDPIPTGLLTFANNLSEPLSLARAISVSSQAYAGVYSSNSSLTAPFPNIPFWDMVPRFSMFPTRIDDLSTMKDMLLGDGGLLDNTGVTSLLRRNVSNIMVLDNTESPLRVNTNLRSLFGINMTLPDIVDPSHDYSRCQVFRSEDYILVVEALEGLMNQGKAAIVTIPVTTVDNTWFGITGGSSVNLTWAYLNLPTRWLDRLPEETREAILDQSNSSRFLNFPYFSTFTQYFLSSEQVNLLSALTYSNAKESEGIILKGLGISFPGPHKGRKNPQSRLSPGLIALIALVCAGVVAAATVHFLPRLRKQRETESRLLAATAVRRPES